MSSLPKVDSIVQKQWENFGLTEKTRLTSVKSAERFLKHVGIALRYWRTEKLPLASLYQAAVGSHDTPPKEKEAAGLSAREEAQRIAIELTNHLLASHQGIEVNVIANRITLIHRDLMPVLYVLVRNHRPVNDMSGVSALARKVFQFIIDSKETTAGQVRKFIGMPIVDINNDPAYHALAELQSYLLIDRGPYIVRKSGIPYLSKEGYPYHSFHQVHGDIVKASSKISREEATQNFIHGYLKGAVFGTDKKLLSMFSSFLTPAELNNALEELTKAKKITMEYSPKDKLIVTRSKT